MKFINYLESITGVGIYPLLSLIIFFTVFVVMLVIVIKADSGFIRYMGNIPLDDDAIANANNNQ